MKRIPLTCALLCLAVSPAAAGGLNFNWNTSKQCPAVQTGNWNFDCDNNDEVMYMVASVTPNIALVGFNGMDAWIDGQSVGSIPAWWQAFNPGSCREAAFSPGVIDVDPTAPCAGSATTRLWTTQAYGGMGAWWYTAPNRIRFVLGFATPGYRAANLSTTTQYNAFHVTVVTTNTVHVAPDPDNGIAEAIPCAGCELGVTLSLFRVGLYGSSAEDQVYLPGGAAAATGCITYNGGAGAGACGATPARNATWGQLKSLYR